MAGQPCVLKDLDPQSRHTNQCIQSQRSDSDGCGLTQRFAQVIPGNFVALKI